MQAGPAAALQTNRHRATAISLHEETSMTSTLIESLESRRLLSAVGPPTVFDAAVRADEVHVNQDFSKFKKDAFHSDSAMQRDAAKIKSSNLSQAPTVKSLVASFDVALLEAHADLQADHLTEPKTVVADEKAILAEQKKLAHDHGNATAVTADQAQLLTDRNPVKTDLDTAISDRFTARENLFNTILNDASSIVTAVKADTQASTGLAAAEQQLNTDSTNCGNILSTDLQQAGTDATQLDTDLTASASQQ
jgi:hypothetical protein